MDSLVNVKTHPRLKILCDRARNGDIVHDRISGKVALSSPKHYDARVSARSMFGHHQCDLPKDAIVHNLTISWPMLLKFWRRMCHDVAKVVLKFQNDPRSKKTFILNSRRFQGLSCSSPSSSWDSFVPNIWSTMMKLVSEFHLDMEQISFSGRSKTFLKKIFILKISEKLV